MPTKRKAPLLSELELVTQLTERFHYLIADQITPRAERSTLLMSFRHGRHRSMHAVAIKLVVPEAGYLGRKILKTRKAVR